MYFIQAPQILTLLRMKNLGVRGVLTTSLLLQETGAQMFLCTHNSHASGSK